MNTELGDALQAIQSPKIRAIVTRSAGKYILLMANQERELLEAMQECEEGQKISVAHALILNLEKNRQLDRVSFSVKHSVESDGEIPNPDQMELQVVTGKEASNG